MNATAKSSIFKLELDRTPWRALALATIAGASIMAALPGEVLAQALPLTITKSFDPAIVPVGGDSTMTVTVTNPNAFPVNNVQFSDTMPAGLDLIFQIGGTCSTAATGGGTFMISGPADTFSSTSNTLTAGQSCDITALVRPLVEGPLINTTSVVTGDQIPDGGPATATLNGVGTAPAVPALGPWQMAGFAALLLVLGLRVLRRRARA